MVKHHVFTGAPLAGDVSNSPSSYYWRRISEASSSSVIPAAPSLSMQPAIFEEASRRISLLYQNIIFHEDEDDFNLNNIDSHVNPLEGPEQTTLITWPPTAIDSSRSQAEGIPFLRPSGSVSRPRTQLETQVTQETDSYNYSDASSIARFPAFTFSLHTLTPLSGLSSWAKRRNHNGSQKVNILVAVLEVEGPDTIRTKKGPDAGNEVSILKIILGDEDGAVCKLTAWREVAERWGGADPELSHPRVKRGDIVFLENILASWESSTTPKVPISLTASPHLKPVMQICFRTMPYMKEDNRLRPDLRLGFSDATVRKVAAVVAWFEGMAGLPAA